MIPSFRLEDTRDRLFVQDSRSRTGDCRLGTADWGLPDMEIGDSERGLVYHITMDIVDGFVNS